MLHPRLRMGELQTESIKCTLKVCSILLSTRTSPKVVETNHLYPNRIAEPGVTINALAASGRRDPALRPYTPDRSPSHRRASKGRECRQASWALPRPPIETSPSHPRGRD